MNPFALITFLFSVLLINPTFQMLDYQKGTMGYSETGDFFKAPNGYIANDSSAEYTFAYFENDSILKIWKSNIDNAPGSLRDKKLYRFKAMDQHVIVYTDSSSLSDFRSDNEQATDTAIQYQNGIFLYVDGVMLRNNRTIAEYLKNIREWKRHDLNRYEMKKQINNLSFMLRHPALSNTLKFVFQDSQHRKIILLLGEKQMTVMCLSDLFAPIIEEYEIALVTERYAVGVDIGKCISTNRPGSASARPTLRPFRDPSNLSAENALPSFEGKSFTAYWRNGLVLSDISLEDFLFTRDECNVIDNKDMLEIGPDIRLKYSNQ